MPVTKFAFRVHFRLTPDCISGRTDLRDLLLRYSADVYRIPTQVIRAAVAKTLDLVWKDGSVTAAVADVVPFFPLTRNALAEILDFELNEMAMLSIKKQHAADIIFDSDLLKYLTSHKYIRYFRYSIEGTLNQGYNY
jgi:hypothetical protein